ncbi:cytochrome b5 domain-containing protein [Clostridium polynesiense]|uniref:cytochrome b5 domain-containing protein n=1 Tax=Clostridium polynesiense TaxID=1325933 RepID=UPI000694C807|nr:cytochrome b5 domain-containing protein [Clostridium polynesiense]
MTEYLQHILDNKYQELCYLKQGMVYGATSMIRKEYKRAFLNKCEEIEDFLGECRVKNMRNTPVRRLNDLEENTLLRNSQMFSKEEAVNRVKEFTIEELSNYNGRGGKPAYVAINGKVYDVSRLGPWAGGSHFGVTAGRDLTKEFENCHNNEMILAEVPIVGELVYKK